MARSGIPPIQFQLDDRPEIRLQKLRRLADAIAALDTASVTINNSSTPVTPTPTPGITMTGPAVLGRLTGTGAPLSLTGAQVTTILPTFTTTARGLVPSPGTATGTRFLRDDGGWAAIVIDPNSILHADLAGLSADDHPQYVLRSILTTDGDQFTQAGGVVTRIGIGTTAQVWRVVAGAPAWQTVSPVLTLGADLSGNATFTDLGNATLNATIVNDAVTDAKLRNSAGLSVIGRASNTLGDPADIVAASDGDVLRRSGTAVGFGSILSTSISDFTEAAQDAVGNALVDSARIDFTYTDGSNQITADVILNSIGNTFLRDSVALSVIGRSANSTGDPGDIAGTDGQILRVAGTTLAFGSILAASISDFTEAAQDAVGGALVDSSRIDFTYNDGANTITADIVLASVDTAYLTNNGVTDIKLRDSAALSVIGRATNTSGDPADITAAADTTVLRRSGTAIGFGTITSAYLSDFVEAAQDAVGAALTDSSRIDFTYNDGANTITADLLVDSVDNTFLANMAQSTIKGRAEGAGTGDPTDLTAAQVMLIIDQEAVTWTGQHAWSLQLLAPNGTAAAPSYAFSNDPDSGLFRSASNGVALSSGGTEVFRTTGAGGAIQITGDFAAFTSIRAVPGFELGIASGNALLQAFDRALSAYISLNLDALNVNLRPSGSTVAMASTGRFSVIDGVVGTPALSFINDTDTGFYRIGANNFGMSTGGTLRWDIDTARILFTLPERGPDGSATAPTFAFSNSTNLGVYRVAADNIGITTAGTLRFDIDTTDITFTLPMRGPDGAVGAPAYSFSADNDNGLYRIGTNQWGLSAAAALQFELGDSYSDVKTQFRVSGDITPPQITANQNDYSPTGLATAAVLRLSTDASRQVTGLTGGADGRRIFVANVGAQPLVFVNESASSTAANRFALASATNSTLQAGGTCWFWYDSTSSRWRQECRLA